MSGNVTRGISLFSLWKASWLFGVVPLISNTGSIASADAAVLCTALADATSGELLKAEGTCSRQVTPASTFKIAISLMGYDSGFLKNEHSPALPFRKGYPDWRPEWRTTTDPTGWIKNSVVWYSQQVTTHMGEAQFQRYVTAFRYGNEDVSGNPRKHDGLTQAWLSSSLQISSLEQLAFLEKLVRRQLPIKPEAYEMTGRITAVGTIGDGWEVHGKTGTGFPAAADGPSDDNHGFGWFVGWASKGARTIVFARLIQDDHAQASPAGIRTRDAFLTELPGLLASGAHDDTH